MEAKGLQICKVLRKKGTRFFSVYVDRRGKVEYKENEWIEPQEHCGPLAVFATVSDAKRFIEIFDVSDGVIYTCEIKKSRESALWIKHGSVSKGCYKRLSTPLGLCPNGTLLAKRVMIKELITE